MHGDQVEPKPHALNLNLILTTCPEPKTQSSTPETANPTPTPYTQVGGCCPRRQGTGQSSLSGKMLNLLEFSDFTQHSPNWMVRQAAEVVRSFVTHVVGAGGDSASVNSGRRASSSLPGLSSSH